MSTEPGQNFKIGKKTANVEFDSESQQLKWGIGSKKKSSVVVPVKDILSSVAIDDSWVVDYVEKSDKKWQVKTVSFSSEQVTNQEWAEKIQEAVVASGEKRPKNLLVFINPDGGKKTGVKDYQKIAAPLFEKAGIKTDIIVTEDGDHHQRVLSDYDISSIDGIVSVGGDGTFMRVAYALVLRTMKDAGKDVDDKDVDLIAPKLRIGILPAGTGQGMVKMYTGMKSVDMATAALHIILGGELKSNYMSVFNNNKLVYYVLMHACYGVFGDMMVISEEKRNLGRLRYAYAIPKAILSKPRQFDASVSYILSDSENNEWETISGCYSVLNVALWSMPTRSAKLFSWVQSTATLCTLDARRGRSGVFKLFKDMVTMNPNTYEAEGMTARKVAAVKYDLPELPEGSTSKQVLNMDGDVFPVSNGEVYLRHFQRFLPVFGREDSEAMK